jgi:HKD family nuclease
MAQASDVRLASAFVSKSGLRMVEDSLAACVDREADVEFLVGLDSQGTEPEAVWELFHLCEKHERFAMYCYASSQPSTMYHPKVYLMRAENDVVCSVGSSNLTAGGLARNVEVNIVLTGTTDDEAVCDLYSAYSRLKFHPDRIQPDKELLSLYEQLARRERRSDRIASKDAVFNSFLDKARTLRRPKPGPRDLVGWLELVYDSLPNGEFTNTDVYRQAWLFERRYPGNLNVRAKIRQQLQILRDMGLLEHRAAGRWHKL